MAREVIGQGPLCRATAIEGLDRHGIRRGDLGRGFFQKIERLKLEIARLRRERFGTSSSERSARIEQLKLTL